ncbi:MAG: hypothetical protein ACKVOB_11625 [Sphingomonas sp.]
MIDLPASVTTQRPGASEAPAPERGTTGRWPMLLGGLLTVAMIVGIAGELLSSGLAGLTRSVPSDPLFYIAFALLYAALPVGDFIIFRKLWRIPASGLVALNNKRIANDVVLGYSGEAYFYAWARARSRMVAAPFGAVKDVAILSAIAGNAATLTMIVLALPLGYGLLKPSEFNVLAGSTVIVVAMSLPFLIFARRVFSLASTTLWWVFGVHLGRIVLATGALALAWHFAMPGVSVGMWLVLSAARLLTSRLPLVPNKDLLFANFAILLIGQGQALTNLMAFTAALTLAVHAVLIGVYGAYALTKERIA